LSVRERLVDRIYEAAAIPGRRASVPEDWPRARGASPRTQVSRRLIAADHAGFVAGAQVLSPAEWEVEPFTDWARRWGCEHAAATAVQVPSDQRSADGPYEANVARVCDEAVTKLAKRISEKRGNRT
jgi:hypothetical protein